MLQNHNKLFPLEQLSQHGAVEPHGLCALLLPPDGTEDRSWHLLFDQF